MLNKRTKVDKIEIVRPYRQLRLRVATVIERDGVEITRKTHTELLNPDADVSGRGSFERAVANAAWTQEIKDKWKNRPRLGPPDERPTRSTEPPGSKPT